MAFYIVINKENESDKTVRYRFESGERSGVFEINKATGEVELFLPMPGDEKEHVFMRAAAKIFKEWREGRLPERLSGLRSVSR